MLFTDQIFKKDLLKKIIKKETLAQVFSCEYCEISKNIFSYRTALVATSELSLAE